MKKINVILFLIGLFSTSFSNAATDVTITVDKTAYQHVTGFGVSNMYGYMAPIQDTTVVAALFGPNSPVGLNIMRTSIYESGPISPSDNQWYNSPYDWDGTVNSVKCARAHGAIILGTPWTPPAEYKTNNSGNGISNGVVGKLKTTYYKKYIQWLNTYCTYMKGRGAKVDFVSLQNEPDYVVDYSGCTYTATEMHTLVSKYASLLTGAKLLGGESYTYAPNYTDTLLNDPNTRKYLSGIGGHFYGYGLNNAKKAVPTATKYGLESWMTEYYIDMTATTATGPLWYDEMALAKNINNAMNAGLSAYIYWYIMDKNSFVNNKDSIYTTVNGVKKVKITPRGYIMAHFTKYIIGATRIGSEVSTAANSNINTSAYVKGDSLVVIAINQSTTNTYNTTISLPYYVKSGTRMVSIKNSVCVKGKLSIPTPTNMPKLSIQPNSINTYCFLINTAQTTGNYATLTHTAGTQWGSNNSQNTVNAVKEHYNNDQGSAWAGAAFAEFKLSNIPAGEMITKATLVYSTYQNGKNARDEKIYVLNQGVSLDYNTLLNKDNYQYKKQKTYAATVNTGGVGLRQNLTVDITDAVRTITAKGQTNVIMQWTDNAGSADLCGMTSSMAPKLLLTVSPSTAYKVKFVDVSGNELKTAIVHNNISAGTVVSASDEEKSSFYSADKTNKYIYQSGDRTFKLVTEANSNVITLVFRKAATYSYTVNSNVGTYNVTASGFEGDKVGVPYPEYQLVNGALYQTDDASKQYNCYFTLTSNNMVKTLNYTDTGIRNVVYYKEVENISGMTATTSGNVSVRCSGAEGGYNAGSSSVMLTTLPVGAYQMTVVVWGNAGTKLLIDYGNGTNWAITTCGYRYAESKSFTLNKATAIKIPQCGSSKRCMDLIYIQNTDNSSSAKASVIDGINSVDADAADAPIYNLQGILVKNPVHGIYIKNGNKFVVK